MNKAIRDSIVTGSPALLVLNALLERGWGQASATLVAAAAAFLAPLAYRAVRKRWPWLMEVDAPRE